MYILVDLYNKTTKTLTEAEAQEWIGDTESTLSDNEVWDLEEYLVIKA